MIIQRNRLASLKTTTNTHTETTRRNSTTSSTTNNNNNNNENDDDVLNVVRNNNITTTATADFHYSAAAEEEDCSRGDRMAENRSNSTSNSFAVNRLTFPPLTCETSSCEDLPLPPPPVLTTKVSTASYDYYSYSTSTPKEAATESSRLDTSTSRRNSLGSKNNNTNNIEALIPPGYKLRDEFVCPITRELIMDPVIAADGHT